MEKKLGPVPTGNTQSHKQIVQTREMMVRKSVLGKSK